MSNLTQARLEDFETCKKRDLSSFVTKSRKRKYSEMTRDIRNISRGHCKACGDCEGFISVSGRVLCDYCGCPPAHHENLVKKARKTSSATASSADSDLSEVSSFEILELEDSDEDETEEESNTSSTSKKSGYNNSFLI